MNRVLAIATLMTTVSLASVGFAQDADRGKTLYATCIQCHGDSGQGNASQKAPRISGQYDWYVIQQITDFKSGVRKNPEMLPFIKDINEQDIKDLAAYILTL